MPKPGVTRLAQRLHQPVRPGEHRDRMGEIENLEIGQALRPQRRGIGRADRRRIARQLGGIIEDRLAARIERGLDFVGLDTLHHLRRLCQLNEALGVHRGTIGTAIDARGRDRAKLAVGARKALRAEHDAVVERRTLGQRFRIMCQHQRIGADRAVRRRDLQRGELRLLAASRSTGATQGRHSSSPLVNLSSVTSRS